MRAAYYGGTALNGSGQNLGLWEYLGTDLADLNTYYANVKQTNTSQCLPSQSISEAAGTRRLFNQFLFPDFNPKIRSCLLVATYTLPFATIGTWLKPDPQLGHEPAEPR